jgi:hypothetical protein
MISIIKKANRSLRWFSGLTADSIPCGQYAHEVEAELRASSKHRVYDGLVLVEERALWPLRWRSIFTLLEDRGARIEPLTLELAPAPAPGTTDLGILQQMLRGERPSRRAREGSAVKGDGTLLLLRGDTPSDLAEVTAAPSHRATTAVSFAGLRPTRCSRSPRRACSTATSAAMEDT